MRRSSPNGLTCVKTAAAAVYTTLRGVQGIYCASISNIDSAVAGTRNILGAEPFILWLPGLYTKEKIDQSIHTYIDIL